MGEELSDILLYLIRLSDRCGIDLGSAALRKMETNARKYPADKARGSSAKYTAYQSDSAAAEASAGNVSSAAKGQTPPHASALTWEWDPSVADWQTASVVACSMMIGAAAMWFFLNRR